jgi:formate C-acetyltransferase
MSSAAQVTMRETMEFRSGKVVSIGSTDRVQRLSAQFHASRPTICLDAIEAYTRVYRESEGEPEILLRGWGIREVLATMPPVIMPDELIVGQPGSKLRSMNVRPATTGWLQNPGEVEMFDVREYDPWKITAEQKKELREEILPYWKNKSVRERWFRQAREIFSPSEMAILTDTTVADMRNFIHAPGSHISPPYDEIIAKGFRGYEQRIDQKLAGLADEDFERKLFYKAALAAIDGIKQWCKNYRQKALELAEIESDPTRVAELRQIADVTGRVPYEPAQTFREALQSIFFVQCFLWMEGCGVGFNIGRADRFLYPYYKRDISSGTLTNAEAMELVECLWIKLTGIHNIKSHRHSKFSPGYFPYQQVHVGGIGKDLKYYTNELSYLFIDALLSVRTTQPTLCVLWHRAMPWELKARAAKLVAAGMGHPSIFNYEQLVNMRMNAEPGERWEDLIWDAKPIGCVETQGAGCRQFGHTDAAQLNGGSIVEMVFTRGIKRVGLHAEEKISIDTGDPTKFATFEDFKAATKKQMEYLVDTAVHGLLMGEKVIAQYNELLIQSMFTDDCIERGKGVANGGAVYNVGPALTLIGLADIANSLAAVKKCVFDDKSVSMEELLKALAADFNGYEMAYKKLMQAPKYGNDDENADDIAREMSLHFAKTVRKHKNKEGSTIDPSVVPTAQNVPYGVEVGALPSPRLATTPLAEGVSPQQGTDLSGPTAVLKSVASLPHAAYTGGTLTNLWVSADSLKTESGVVKFINLVDTYVYNGGYHVQINSISKKTLKEAQNHPEAFPTLMVRVAGYSAYFVDLAKATQNDIIARTDHTL